MFWLTLTNRHNFVTDDEEAADKAFEKSHDWISWLLLGLAALLILGSSVCD